MTKDRRLGRGLAALLGNPMDEGDGAPSAFVEEESTSYVSAMHSQSETPRTALDALAPHANDNDDSAEQPSSSDAGLLLLNIQDIETNPFQPRRDFNPDTARYDFRVFMLHLGLIGDEFKTARLHLMANLNGSAAWQHGRPEQRPAADPAPALQAAQA